MSQGRWVAGGPPRCTPPKMPWEALYPPKKMPWEVRPSSSWDHECCLGMPEDTRPCDVFSATPLASVPPCSRDVGAVLMHLYYGSSRGRKSERKDGKWGKLQHSFPT